MQELGIDVEQVLEWFPHEIEAPYVLVRVPPEHADNWVTALRDAVRRCYLTDERLRARAEELEEQLQGTTEFRQAEIISSKLPGPGSIMAGDFGEILVYFYQSAKAHPLVAFGPKKWRLKQDRRKSAPFSDVIHFILPNWPTPSDQDKLLCAEVKTKSTNGASTPIQAAVEDSAKDRTSRLSKTLQWLKERAIGEPLGAVEIAHLDRFINATDHPKAEKRFHAVAVICSSLVDAELGNAPAEAPADCTLVVVAVPNLQDVYTRVFESAKASTAP